MNPTHDRTNIEAGKRALPLPELLRKLGFTPPAAGVGNMASPFATGRRQKTDSFSLFRRADAWGWCDRSGGAEVKGDEITLLERLESLATGAAIARYLELAGVDNATRAPAPRGGKAVPKGSGDSAPPDWPGAVAKFTAGNAARLAEWRGYSREFVAWLHAQGLVGMWGKSFALPVHDATGLVISAHYRRENGSWGFWPTGKGNQPLFIGDPAAARTMVFESQWDAFAIMDAAGWHRQAPAGWAVLVTRGAASGKFAARASGEVYAWPQNDQEKDGKRAAEGWLRDVAAHAPGAVFRVATPAEHKDANDWTRAGAVDVWAAAGAASAISIADGRSAGSSKPAADVPATATPAPGVNGTAPEIDPAAVLEEMGLYWLNGSPSFFLRKEENGRTRFLEMGASEVRRKLRVRGFYAHPDTKRGEHVSQIDRILDAATETRAVDFAASIAGTTAGVYDLPGGRVLVRESPRLVLPAEGSFQTIEAFLAALLGEDAIRFCAWLKVAYEALIEGKRRPGQAVIIIGPPDCGKSRIQHQIITPILAGRSADPKSFFFGRTDFNAELVGAEHLLIEEVPSSSKHEERLFFGERIKEIVANDTARLHKKNRDAATVAPFWRLSITLNDNPEKLRCLPPLTDDLAEKIIMLSARQAPEFWTRFDGHPDPRLAFREAIECELPAFAHFLLTMPIPAELQGRRYGVASFIPEEIGHTIFEGEPEHHLLLLINKGLPAPDGDEPWRGDAEDLKQLLCGESSAVRGSAVRLLGSVQISTLGIWLGHLAEKFPARVKKHRTAKERGWIIHPVAV